MDVMRPLTSRELDSLASFLADKEDAMPLVQAQGYLTAVAIAPTAVMPSQWVPDVIGEDGFESREQFERITGLVMRLYNGAVTALMNGTRVAPQDPEALEDWCHGFMVGATNDDEWMGTEEVQEHLFPIAVVARDFDLVGKPDGDGTIITDPAPHIMRFQSMIDQHVHESNRIWTSVRHARLAEEQASGSPSSSVSVKVGRNEPCPCGSGKKFKKCHGAA